MDSTTEPQTVAADDPAVRARRPAGRDRGSNRPRLVWDRNRVDREAAGSPEPAADLPTIAALSTPERILVWALRRWLRDIGHRQQVWREFRGLFDHAGAVAAMSGLERLVASLRAGARRTYRLHGPCCPTVEAWEVGVLAIVGSCQRLDDNLAARNALWLVRHPFDEEVVAGSALLARPFLEAEMIVPDRRLCASTP